MRRLFAVTLVFVALAGRLAAQELTVTTLAGVVGDDGISDGTGAGAKFKYPHGLSADLFGNIYIADTSNNTVRRMSLAGEVVTFAGAPHEAGSIDGQGFDARFDTSTGVGTNAAGLVYIGDYGNSTIRVITSAGVVTTLAGVPGSNGFADGTGSEARFNRCQGVAVDLAGNLYTSDRRNHAIRKITPDGVVSTLAGLPGVAGGADGTGRGARFNYPVAVAVDTEGNVYVADKDNHAIRKVTPSGVVTTIAGFLGRPGYADGTGSAASFNTPEGVVATPLGEIYVMDTNNFVVRKISASGVVTTVAGQPGVVGSADGTGSAAAFNFPTGIAADQNGNLFISDTSNHTIRHAVSTAPLPQFTPVLIVPGQARQGGAAGAFFRSAFWMTNASSVPAQVRLTYVSATGASTGGAASSRTVTLSPWRSLNLADVLTLAFGATTDTYGVVLVEVAAGSVAPVVAARTYNDAGASGTYGQYIPALALPGESTTTATIEGLGGGSSSRSNVGVVNLGSTPLAAVISVYDANGIKVGSSLPISVDPQSVVQLDAVDVQAGVAGMALFSVKITASARFYAYASRLDGITSDPILIPANLAARSTQWLDGLASAEGVGGTLYKSNLLLANRGTAAASVVLEFTARDTNVVAARFNLGLQPRESVYYADVLRDVFELSDTAGWLTITTLASTPVVAWARTYSDDGPAGTFGQFIPAFGTEDLLGERGAILQGVSSDAKFRTNGGFVNVSAVTASVTASLWNSEGTKLGEKTYTLAPRQSLFVRHVASDIAGASAAELSNGYIKVVPSIAGTLYAWISSVENLSTDQIFVRPVAIP